MVGREGVSVCLCVCVCVCSRCAVVLGAVVGFVGGLGVGFVLVLGLFLRGGCLVGWCCVGLVWPVAPRVAVYYAQPMAPKGRKNNTKDSLEGGEEEESGPTFSTHVHIHT